MMAQIEVENPAVVDWWWDEHEYRVPSKAWMKKERQSYEEEERGGSYGVQGGRQGYMG